MIRYLDQGLIFHSSVLINWFHAPFKTAGVDDSPLPTNTNGGCTVYKSAFMHAPPFPFRCKTGELVSEPFQNKDKVFTTFFTYDNSWLNLIKLSSGVCNAPPFPFSAKRNSAMPLYTDTKVFIDFYFIKAWRKLSILFLD